MTRPSLRPRVVTCDGASLFGIDANSHEPVSQGGLPLRAIWHNRDITDIERLRRRRWLTSDDPFSLSLGTKAAKVLGGLCSFARITRSRSANDELGFVRSLAGPMVAEGTYRETG